MTTTTTTLMGPITIQGVVGSGYDGCIFLWFYFVYSFYVALGGNFKGKAWVRFCKRRLATVKIFTRIHKLFVSTQISPIGGTINEVKTTLQSQLHLVC